MRRSMWLWAAILGAGCVVTEGSGDLLAPERDARPTASAEGTGPGVDDGFAFDSYKDAQAEADAEASAQVDAETVLEGLGTEGVRPPPDGRSGGGTDQAMRGSMSADASGSPGGDAPFPAPPGSSSGDAAGRAATPPPWTPSSAVSLSWGLRLLSTVDQASPPRAILGLPDGSETVVKAGDMLPDERVVVLAIGRGVVQLGQVAPQGDHVTVESVFLKAMYPGATPPPPE